MTDNNRTGRPLGKYKRTTIEITKLLQKAADHPLGKKFLVEGSLDSVAATFGVHAFVVDAARESLKPAHEIPRRALRAKLLAHHDDVLELLRQT